MIIILMKKILLIVLLFLIACRSSPSVSFDSLSNAFISWYFRYHPVKSSFYDINANHKMFMKLEAYEVDEYYADISRFLIELSQIDVTKLDPSSRVDYKILYHKLELMKYILNEQKPWEWNPLWYINELFDGIYILSESNNLLMEEKVNGVLSRLKYIPLILETSQSTLVYFSPQHVIYTKNKIDLLIELLNELPIKLNADNFILDNIDSLIRECINSLQDYKDWLNSDATRLDRLKFPEDINLMHTAFNHFVSNKYLKDSAYKMARKKITPSQNRLFNISLPIYLKDNDEPVWLDRQDTLEVIKWTIEKIKNDPKNYISNTTVLSNYYESISRIEKFIYEKSINFQNPEKEIQLMFKPKYNMLTYGKYLFDHLPLDPNLDIVYYIDRSYESLDRYQLVKQEIDLENIKNIIPGYYTQHMYAQKNRSLLRYLFPNSITQAAWKAYVVRMIIDEGYGNWEDEYHIFKLRDELLTIVIAIAEIEYYSGSISRDDAKLYIKSMGFVDDVMSEKIIEIVDLEFFSGTKKFIGMMEINSMYDEYKVNKGDNFSLSDFHNFILQDGIIPISELKKKMIN